MPHQLCLPVKHEYEAIEARSADLWENCRRVVPSSVAVSPVAERSLFSSMAIVKCRKNSTPANCKAVWTACANTWGEGWAQKFNRSVYDATKTEKEESDSNDFFDNKVAAFMSIQDRKNRLGVSAGPDWHPGSNAMMVRFWDSGDVIKSYIPHLELILKSGIDFLLYAVSVSLVAVRLSMSNKSRVIKI
jgi:hypothetical protein